MASTNDSNVTLTAHCLCKANTFTTQVPKSKLPLPAPICHCWSCRHVTGALYTSKIRWPESSANVDVSKLKVYSFSPDANLLFCPTCSTPIFWEVLHESDRPLEALTGALKNDKSTSLKFMAQGFVGDTIDGGASFWLQNLNADGSQCRRFKLKPEGSAPEDELSDDWPPADEFTGFEKKVGDSVPVRCRCKGVDFVLERGDYSDLAKEQLPWNVDPDTYKLSTTLCGCDSCRMQGGIDLWPWAYFHIKYMTSALADGPFPQSSHELKAFVDRKDSVVGSLAYHASSPGVLRFFCSTCSATFFFAEDKRPDLLDVSVGLLDAPDGARAEGFLSWSLGKIDFKEDADGGWRAGLFERVEQACEKWRVARGYPKNFRRAGQ